MTLPSSGISLDVGAGAERPAGGGDDQHPDVVVVLGLVVGGAQLGDHVRAERVERVGPVQRDGGLVAVDLVVDGVVGLAASVVLLESVSSAVEVRCAPFAERGQALFEIGCPAGEFQVEQLLVHRLRQGGVLAVVRWPAWPVRSPPSDRRPAAPAGRSAASSRSDGATASWIRPQSAASDPLTFSPSSSIRLARATPDQPRQQPRRAGVRAETAGRRTAPRTPHRRRRR